MDKYIEVKDLAPKGDTGLRIKQWDGLSLVASKGSSVKSENYKSLSVQVEGCFGAKGRLVFEGSNDGENYHVLQDKLGFPLTFSRANLCAIESCFVNARPRVVDGDETTNLVVTFVLKQ